MKKYQYEAVGIKSKKGMQIYDIAMGQAASLDKQMAKAITKKEIERLDRKRLQAINDAVARAKLLNPPPKAKKAGLKRRKLKFS